MDWAALGSREAVLAVCARFRVDFAQAEDYLLARQLGQAEERAEADEQEEEEEEEDDDEGEQEDEGTIIPMPGQDRQCDGRGHGRDGVPRRRGCGGNVPLGRRDASPARRSCLWRIAGTIASAC